MASSNRTPQRPARPPFDSQFEIEQSRVRSTANRREESQPRQARETTLPPPPEGFTADAPSARPTQREAIAERAARIDALIARAETALQRLRPTDWRTRLLSSAILRRDSVLLDRVLSTFHDIELG